MHFFSMYIYISHCGKSLRQADKEPGPALGPSASRLPLGLWDSRALSLLAGSCYNPLIFPHSVKFPLLHFIGLLPLGHSDQLCFLLFILFNHQ